MNNEPVAWMTAQGIQDVCTVNEKEEMGNDFDDYTIPLYTHPAELTDDPLVNFKPVWQEKPELTLTDEEILKMAANMFHYSEYRLVIEFARAILRKAQE
jgi:hypothetical protein